LEHYYRLESQGAIDSVCDRGNDKGIDGIWVNDEAETITVFQVKLFENPAKTIGDSSLRTFAGTLRQFETAEGLQAMVDSAGMGLVASLVTRLDLMPKIGSFTVKGEFISNVEIDSNGTPYLTSAPNITFVGKSYLESRFISDSRDLPTHDPVSFDTSGYTVTEYDVDSSTKAIIAPVKAAELVRLQGIADQSLFDQNVRGPLGKTAINKGIVESVRNTRLHKSFPLFHNGITIVAAKVNVSDGRITTEDYYVVNGCQSLTSLFNNQGALTDELRILTKFIQLTEGSPIGLGAMITKFSNNQNGVHARDFMSNNAMQIRLKNEFRLYYSDQYALEIKRGEKQDNGVLLTNEDAGLYLMAFDLKEPWATHRRYQVFGDKHTEIFGRPEVTADRIVFCKVIMDAVTASCGALKNGLAAKYVLTRYFMMYVIRLMIEEDPIGKEMLVNPESFVRSPVNRARFQSCVRGLADDIVTDLNIALEDAGPDFDYRNRMRDATWVKKLANEFFGTRIKLVRRKTFKSIKETWES